MMTKLSKLEILKDMVQMAVDKGATTVEQIHKTIADLPFEALEKSGLIEDDQMNLREKNQQTIGRVYNTIREINREIGDLASDMFEIAEDGQIAARKTGDTEEADTITDTDAEKS